jgi:hypothetical protein
MYKIIVILTLLSLNSFAREGFYSISDGKPFSAKVAKNETEQGKIDLEKNKVNDLFSEIKRYTSIGVCGFVVYKRDLPQNWKELLTKLGYKLEDWTFKDEEGISWCD